MKILPAIPDRPVPDAQHLVLQFLSILVALALVSACRSLERDTPSDI